MEDLGNWVTEISETTKGAAAAVAGWFAALNMDSKWKKVALFVAVALAVVIILNILF